MAEPFKNLFTPEVITQLGNTIKQISNNFNLEQFNTDVFNHEWEALELKGRMKHVTQKLHKQLPKDYNQAIDIIVGITDIIEKENTQMNITHMVMPNYVELYGVDHLQKSIAAMEKITQFVSCEFAVRPYIIKYPKQMMKQMLQWSKHPHQNVRRFASEGCRPRLPWAVALPDLKKDPAPIFPILENLKNDESDFVRKSVANNLNDISKDHPDVVLDMASQWKGTSKNTDWIVKHACRTLLKQAHPKAMSLFGFNHSDDIKVNDFKINTPKVVFGNHLDFSFSIKNNGSEATTIRLEYYIYFIKANGSLAKKIFKISEKNYSASSNNIVQRKHAIKPITTRKYYPGLHQIALVVNGKELHKHDFELLME